MIHIFCDYAEAGSVPAGLNLGGQASYDSRLTLPAKWAATTAQNYPGQMTFKFLESAAACRDFANWETPDAVVDGAEVTQCGAGFPWHCGFGLFSPYTGADAAPV